MYLFMSATCCFCLCWNKRKRDFYQRTEAMALCECYLLAFPTVIKSLRRRGLASYFHLKTSEGESARRYRGTSGSVLYMWNRFYWTGIFCALLNKEGKMEVVFFGFWIQLKRPVLALTGMLNALLSGNVRTGCASSLWFSSHFGLRTLQRRSISWDLISQRVAAHCNPNRTDPRAPAKTCLD